METVATYKNDPAFKAAFLAEISKHEEADALLKGTYGEFDPTFKGCAIGCSVHSLNTLQGKPQDDDTKFADHGRVANELGFPLWLAYLEDNLFESLPSALSKTWPRRLAEGPPGTPGTLKLATSSTPRSVSTCCRCCASCL